MSKGNRRELHFDRLDQAVSECQRLLESGYIKNGNWSLAQIAEHMRVTMESNLNGYPWWMSLAMPVRPILRWLMLPKLLKGHSPAGLPTAPMFVPSEELADSEEVFAFSECVSKFLKHQGRLYPHPGFGKFTLDEAERFHAAHASHHLSFLSDAD